jgi:peptidoglycan/xylan/chitin deacetylase (PgdA/CDA1 family)
MSKFAITNISFAFVAVLCILTGLLGFVYWWLLLFAGILLYSALVFCGVVKVSWQFFMPITCKLPNVDKHIFLSFDDGPQEQTEAVLDFLKKHELKANFFCIGKHLDENPKLAQRLFNEGHFIGNHSYSHTVNFPMKSEQDIVEELKQTNSIIESYTGKTCHFFRPPFGVSNPTIAKAVAKPGMICVGWSIRSFDTKDKNGIKAVNKIKRNLKSGDIVLLHDHSSHILTILEELAPFLKEQNYKTQRIDHYLRINQ